MRDRFKAVLVTGLNTERLQLNVGGKFLLQMLVTVGILSCTVYADVTQ